MKVVIQLALHTLAATLAHFIVEKGPHLVDVVATLMVG
jgi:hypothetical protein